MLTSPRKVILFLGAAVLIVVVAYGVTQIGAATERWPSKAECLEETHPSMSAGCSRERFDGRFAGERTGDADGVRDRLVVIGIAAAATLIVLGVAFALTSSQPKTRQPLRVELASSPQESSPQVRERLAQLDSLRSDGLVTDDEYASRRTAILDAI